MSNVTDGDEPDAPQPDEVDLENLSIAVDLELWSRNSTTVKPVTHMLGSDRVIIISAHDPVDGADGAPPVDLAALLQVSGSEDLEQVATVLEVVAASLRSAIESGNIPSEFLPTDDDKDELKMRPGHPLNHLPPDSGLRPAVELLHNARNSEVAMTLDDQRAITRAELELNDARGRLATRQAKIASIEESIDALVDSAALE